MSCSCIIHYLLGNFLYRSHSVVSEAVYELPKLPSEEKVASPDEGSSIPGFDLNKFNECIPERRAILDHLNKEIAVNKHNPDSIYICCKFIINSFFISRKH